MRAIIAAAFLGALLVPASAAPVSDSPAAPAGDRPIVLALNPQPEPPGRAKIKRIYSGKDDSRRLKEKLKPQPGKSAPATPY